MSLAALVALTGCHELLGLEGVGYRTTGGGSGGDGGGGGGGGAGGSGGAPFELTGELQWLYLLDDESAPGQEQRAMSGRFASDGDVVLGARIAGSPELSPPVSSEGKADVGLLTLDGSSGALDRHRVFGDEAGISLVMDTLGTDVIAFGHYRGVSVDVGSELPAACNPMNTPPSCPSDLYAVKYDDELDWRWTRTDGIAGQSDLAIAVSTIEPAAAVVGANIPGSGGLFGEMVEHDGTGMDAVVARLEDGDVAGSTVAWVTSLATGEDEHLVSLASDATRVAALLAHDATESRDLVVASVGAADGSVRWRRRLSGQLNPRAIAIGPDGGLFVSATLLEPSVTPDGDPIEPEGTVDLLLARFDAAGSLTWWKTHPVSEALPLAPIAVDDRGHVLVGGTFKGSLDLGEGHLFEAGSRFHGFVAKLDEAGAPLWSHLYAPTAAGGDSQVRDVDVTPGGEALVVGAFRGTVDFDLAQPTATAPDAMDPGAAGFALFAARYDP